MRFSLQSKVRIYSGYHGGYVLPGGTDFTQDPAAAQVLTLKDALSWFGVVSDAMRVEFELVTE